MTTQARHARYAVTPSDALVRRFLATGRWHYLALLPSDMARSILERKYDAFTTDAAYDTTPHGTLGPIGWLVDAAVRALPLHRALRERLVLVKSTIAAECQRLGLERPHVLTAPCGLMRDVIEASARTPMRVTALDLDDAGDVLPEATRRADRAGLDVAFARQDLLDTPSLVRRLDALRPVHIVNCIGLTPWLDLDEIETLARTFREHALTPDGLLVIDNFAPHPQSSLGRDLEIETRYHDPAAFTATLERAGFRVQHQASTLRHINTVTAARAV